MKQVKKIATGTSTPQLDQKKSGGQLLDEAKTSKPATPQLEVTLAKRTYGEFISAAKSTTTADHTNQGEMWTPSGLKAASNVKDTTAVSSGEEEVLNNKRRRMEVVSPMPFEEQNNKKPSLLCQSEESS